MRRALYVHVCARAERLPITLTTHVVAAWLWPRLRRAFPDALAAVLMSNHLHVLARAPSDAVARHRLGGVISGLRRSDNPGAAIAWLPVFALEALTELAAIRRQVRYIALNPCRAGLIDCPAAWLWSTHRDVLGAVVHPWCSAQRLAFAFDACPDGFAARHHAYVSGDPSVAASGTPFPTRHDGDPRRYSLEQASHAAIAGVRGAPSALTKHGPARDQFLALAKRAQFHRDAVAATCGVSPRTMRRLDAAASSDITSATLLCLGDVRLRGYLQPAYR